MNIMEQIEQMSEQEIEQLLATEFGEELEKQASAELAQADLAQALYAYGAFLADSEMNEGEELSKEASAEYEQAGQEIAQLIEDALVESGILDTEDTAQLHKEAQAAAAFIFEGYADQFEKTAGVKEMAAKAGKAISKKVKAAKEAMKSGAKATGKFAKKHKKPLAIGAGAAGLAAGVYGYKKHQEKKASEITASELAEIISEEQAVDEAIFEGIEKMAAKGKAKLVDKAMKAVKGFAGKAKEKVVAGAKLVNKNKKPLAAGAALGGLLGAGGMALAKKKKED